VATCSFSNIQNSNLDIQNTIVNFEMTPFLAKILTNKSTRKLNQKNLFVRTNPTMQIKENYVFYNRDIVKKGIFTEEVIELPNTKLIQKIIIKATCFIAFDELSISLKDFFNEIENSNDGLYYLLDEGFLIRDWDIHSLASDIKLDEHVKTPYELDKLRHGSVEIPLAEFTHADKFRWAKKVISSGSSVVESYIGSKRDTMSGGVSVNAYNTSNVSLDHKIKSTIEDAITTYKKIAHHLYPSTTIFQRRMVVIKSFVESHCTDTFIPIELTLKSIGHIIERYRNVAFEDNFSSMTADNDRTWQFEKMTADKFTNLIQNSLLSNKEHVSIPINLLPTTTNSITKQQPLDWECRVAQLNGSDKKQFCIVDSVSSAGRLTSRHKRIIKKVHSNAQLNDIAYEIVANPITPEQTALDMRTAENAILLTGGKKDSNIKFNNIEVMYCSSKKGFVFRKDKKIIKLTYKSILSPSHNPTLYFLRFLELCSNPVLTIPNWLPLNMVENITISPRISVGNLIILPKRNYVRTVDITFIFNIKSRKSRIKEWLIFASSKDLPALAFVYSDKVTKPSYIELRIPSSIKKIYNLWKVSKVIIFEEPLPAPEKGTFTKNMENVATNLIVTSD
jgi:hypothetical protein